MNPSHVVFLKCANDGIPVDEAVMMVGLLYSNRSPASNTMCTEVYTVLVICDTDLFF